MQTAKKSSEYSNRVSEIRRLRIQGHLAKAQVLLDSFPQADVVYLESDEASQLRYEKGCLLLNQGDFNEAYRIFEELMRVDTLGKAKSTGLGLNGLGLCSFVNGYHQQALDFFHRALEFFEQMDCQKEVVKVLGNLSECLLELGEVFQAKELLQRAMQISEENNNMYGIAWARAGLGSILAVENRLEESRWAFVDAISRFDELEIQKVWVLCEAAEVFTVSGELQFAENLLQRATKAAKYSSVGEMARVQLQWGILEFERGNLGLASHHYQSALSRSNEVKMRARAYLQMARVHLSKYRSELRDYAIDEIEYYVDQALELAEKPTPIIPLMIEINFVKAGLAETQLDFDKAINILQEAKKHAIDIKIPTLSKKLNVQVEQVKQKRKNLMRFIQTAHSESTLRSQEITNNDAKSYLEEILRIVGHRSR
ncbi:MAG: tetratricopeptide repeat protein [Candidatus Heimdallarchaeota archaeon]